MFKGSIQKKLVLITIFAIVSGLVSCGVWDSDGTTNRDDEGQVRQWRTAFPTDNTGALLSVWGAAENDVWSVGGQPDAGVVWHFDGNEWSLFGVPDGPLLNWVHGAGDSLYMVGNGGRILRRVGAGPFEVMESGTETPLWGVWVSPSGLAWAVGGDPLSVETNPIILHYDGVAWRTETMWETDRSFRSFFKVWGTADDHVLVVGSDGVALIYDGSTWTQIPTASSRDFISLWGSSATDIVAVGGRSNGTVGRWDGTDWTTEILAGEPGLNGVWVDQDGRAWLAGERGRILRLEPGGFDVVRDTNRNGTLLHGIFGIGEARWAVGGTLDRRPPWNGVALESRP